MTEQLNLEIDAREDLPAGWVLTTLESVLMPLEDGRLLHHGWSPQCHPQPSPSDEEWGVLKTTAIQDGDFQPEHNKHLPDHLTPRPHLEVKRGDLLITCAGPRARCGVPCYVRQTRPKLILSGKMYRFRVPADEMSPLFLEGWLRTPTAQAAIDRMKTGISDSGLNLTHGRFLPLQVPVAPRDEQDRIVEAIESYFTRLDDAVANLERVQRNLQRYRASVLKAAVEGRLVPTEADLALAEGRDYEPASELLDRILAERRRRWEEAELEKMEAKGKPPKNDKWKAKYKEPAAPDTTDLPELPEGWCWAALDQLLAEDLRNGKSARASKDGNGVRTLTLTAVTEANFTNENTKVTVADPDQVSDLWLQPNDILVQRSNTPELVGTAAMYRGKSNWAIFPDLLIRVRVASAVLPQFVEAVLRARPSRIYFRLAAQGIAGSMPKISQQTVRDLPIPLPPRLEQERILDDLARTMSVVNHADAVTQKNLVKARGLYRTVLRWAFEGRLADQDPSDEPAAVLLKRIQAERDNATKKKSNGGRRKSTKDNP